MRTNPDWHPWRMEDDWIVLEIPDARGGRYDFHEDYLKNKEDLGTWVLHLSGKGWCSGPVLLGLANLYRDLRGTW